LRIATLLRTPLYANALYLWASTGVTAVSGLVFWTLVARLYSTDDVGLASAALSALSLLAMLSHLGLGLGLIRYLPESGSRGPRLANAVFTTSAAVSVVLAAVFLLGLPLWASRLDFLREQPLYAVAFVAFVLAATLTVVQMHSFVAIRKAQYSLVQVVFLLLGRLALPALMALFFGAFGIVASGGIAVALAAVVGFALLSMGLKGYRPGAAVDVASVVKLFPFSVANYVSDSLLLTPGLLLPLMVVGMLGSSEGAYFYMAWFLGYVLSSASTSLALSLFAEGSYDPRALRRLSRNAVAAGLAVAAVGATFFLLLGDKLLLVFGRDYATEGATLLRIVALAALPAAVVNVYLGALRVTKRIGELVAIAAVVGVTTVALSAVLLPTMGLVGAGVGHGLGQGLGLALVILRLLSSGEGTVPQRVHGLLATLIGDRPKAAQREGCGAPELEEQAEASVLEAKTERGLSITALVCALNEEESLPHVLPRIPGWVDELLLVDGRSTDNTVAVAKALRPDVRIVHQPGRGKGDALRCGIEQATGDIVVTLDADGETDPRELARFVGPLLDGCDFAKGSRLAHGRPRRMSRYRWFGNKVLTWTCNLLYGTRFTDICSGYNAFWKARFLQLELTYDPNEVGCSMEQQMIVRAKKACMRVQEVAHASEGRIAGASVIGGFKQATKQGFRDWFVVLRERIRG
jgi:O-antigen/teichoic acid export membrane protein